MRHEFACVDHLGDEREDSFVGVGSRARLVLRGALHRYGLLRFHGCCEVSVC